MAQDIVTQHDPQWNEAEVAAWLKRTVLGVSDTEIRQHLAFWLHRQRVADQLASLDAEGAKQLLQITLPGAPCRTVYPPSFHACPHRQLPTAHCPLVTANCSRWWMPVAVDSHQLPHICVHGTHNHMDGCTHRSRTAQSVHVYTPHRLSCVAYTHVVWCVPGLS